jgi:hypothetical protein
MRENKRNAVVVAYHEAGHAVIGWWLGIPLHRASIVPDGKRLGHVNHTTWVGNKRSVPGVAKRHQRDARIAMFVLAGLVAESMRDAKCWIEMGEMGDESSEALNIGRTLDDRRRSVESNGKVSSLVAII